MRSNLFFTMLGSLVILFFSCSKKHFDVKSNKNLSTPTTLEDLQGMLDNAKVFNRFSPRMNEASADYIKVRPEVFQYFLDYDKNAYMWSKEYANINVIDWSNGDGGGSSYTRVYETNLILEILEKINLSENPALHANVKGQALFQRGRSFFELAQTFSPLLDNDTQDKRLGIPLRLESDILAISKRSTVKETYAQILKDLEMSVESLPLNQNFKTRPSKIAAYALLARVYLSMENYDKAKLNSDLSLKSVADNLIWYKNLDYSSITNPFIGYIHEVIFYSYMNSVAAFTLLDINIDNDLYNSYEENDLRKKVYFNYDIGSELVTFKGTYAGFGFDHYFNGLATDELYLIRAECYARENNVELAMKDINTLLERRWLPPFTPIQAVDADDALRIILNERKKELVMRGIRWSDLRRLNRDPRFAQTFTRTINGKTYTLEPNSYKYTFPIPDDIIQFTGMAQNPGW